MGRAEIPPRQKRLDPLFRVETPHPSLLTCTRIPGAFILGALILGAFAQNIGIALGRQGHFAWIIPTLPPEEARSPAFAGQPQAYENRPRLPPFGASGPAATRRADSHNLP